MNTINNLKSLSIDMICEAGSGHPGIALSSANILYTLYAKHMHINPKDPQWINRDRFVLSAGHGSALLYACLYMLGFLTLKDLKEFRKINSVTPGHPEFEITPGVDMTTGPLGQGFASAVGMAIAGKRLKEKFKDSNLIDYYTYVLVSDGDLMEGISYEAASLAGTLKLDNLIILYDSNKVSLDGKINNTFKEDVCERFDSMGFYTTSIKNNVNEINKAIMRAKKSKMPALIEIKTIIGEGSLLEGSNLVHGKPLTEDDVKQLKEKLNIPLEPFYVDDKAMEDFKNLVMNNSLEKYVKWQDEYKEYIMNKFNNDESDFIKFYNKTIEIKDEYPYKEEKEDEIRESNSKIMNYLASQTDLLFGGSSDLASSCKTYITDGGDFSSLDYSGRNIWFGVREHAMGAILNGIALSGYFPYGSTFLAFADYLKPAIRMSALMDLPVTYIFTHDGVSNGSDGPTHEPFDQLPMLRSIPNLNVYRPCDFDEVLGSWNAIMTLKKPSALIISRDKVLNLETTDFKKVMHGGYIVYNEDKDIDAVIIATGSEVGTCVKIAKELQSEYKIRVVSMPSIELFLKMPKKYQYQILPAYVKTFFVEASSQFGLRRFVTNDKYLITIDKFGYSGSKEDVLNKLNFSYEKIKDRIKKLL